MREGGRWRWEMGGRWEGGGREVGGRWEGGEPVMVVMVVVVVVMVMVVMPGAGMGSGVVGEVGGAGPGVCGEGAICRERPKGQGPRGRGLGA
jgi:hypothetical protein